MDNLGTVTSENFTINGQDYTPEDATNLIELGNKYKKIESDLNTSLDKVYPEYTRASQENKTLKEQLAERDTRLAELSRPKAPELSEDKQAVRTAARAAGLVDDDYLKEKGYMTKSEMDEYYNTKQTNQKLVDNILTKASGLEKTIDGSDGRVPFDSDAVLAFASAYNIEDLTEAYDKMNTKGNARWKEAQLEKEERPGLNTLNKSGGKREPLPVKVTDDNFKTLWDEQFGGNE
jgi:cell division septum initiation protein DivIVA